jgi:hypothetical protein
MLSCGRVAESITAAHDTVWTTLFDMITTHLPADWKTWKDKFVSMTGIPCQMETDLKPDAILLHKDSKTIHVLEFKRASDFWPDSFERGFLRKWIRYRPLIEAFLEANPGWTVDLSVFSLGDRGLLDEKRWQENWNRLALPESGFKPFATKAAGMAQTVATTILECYNVALRNMNAAPGTY